MTSEDPRIELLAQHAGKTLVAGDLSYYRVAAKEFLAFADALEKHYYSGDMPPPAAPEPVYPIDVCEERARTAKAIRDRIGRALRLAREHAWDGEDEQSGGALAIAMELQALLDELE